MGDKQACKVFCESGCSPEAGEQLSSEVALPANNSPLLPRRRGPELGNV